MKNDKKYESPVVTLVTFGSEIGFAQSPSAVYDAKTETYEILPSQGWN